MTVETATNLNVDVGPNTTALLQKLADQIGVTVDKVWPWFVQQQIIEAWTAIAIIVVLLLISIPTFVIVFRKSRNDAESWSFIFTASVMFVIGSIVGGLFEGAEAAKKLLNPNYYAAKALLKQVRR